MGRTVGIDLGTTNSCVAVYDGGEARILPSPRGSRTTPSVVGIADDGERLVGEIARRQAISSPTSTVFAVKRLMGRKLDSEEIRSISPRHLPMGIEAAENGDVRLRVRDELYSPPEISSMILREMKQYAEAALEDEVTEAIVTVPAYFDDTQRQATRDAGRIAGLEVKRIVNEPTAAALAYGLGRGEQSRHVAVFDLGGGTFDISILEIREGVFDVKATNGDSDLGGEDFDARIVDWLVDGFREETGMDLSSDRMALQRLKEAAERAKAELSTEESAEISLPFLSLSDGGPLHLQRTLERSLLEEMVGDLVERTRAPCLDALEQARLRPSEIDEVLLVGGQTRMPLVVRVVEDLFGQPPNRDLNPDEVVAAGAAIQGAILGGELRDVLLLDVTPLSLGIETHGGVFTRLIERNSTIPTRMTQVFSTVADNQDKVEIHILQGERRLASENRSLGHITLAGIPAAPKGFPQIEVTFAIDSNSIHTVSAKDLDTGRSQSVQIDAASGLDEEEIERLVQEAADQATRDDERHQLRRLRVRLEGLVSSGSKVYEQFEGLLDDANRRSVRDSFSQARRALRSQERDKIELSILEMETVSRTLSQLMLESSRGS